MRSTPTTARSSSAQRACCARRSSGSTSFAKTSHNRGGSSAAASSRPTTCRTSTTTTSRLKGGPATSRGLCGILFLIRAQPLSLFVGADALKRLGLYLADALARDAELFTHLLERVVDAVFEPVAQFQNLPLLGR